MSNLQAFLQQNVVQDEVIERDVSARFKDEKGKPVKWQFKAITEERNGELRKAATKRAQLKNRIQETTDMDAYLYKLAAETVVYPNLKDAELQKSWGVTGADGLLKKMLLPGEFGKLVSIVQEVNGFDPEAFQEMVDEAKN